MIGPADQIQGATKLQPPVAAKAAAVCIEEAGLQGPASSRQAREARASRRKLACWLLGPVGLGLVVGLAAPRAAGCDGEDALWQTVSAVLGWTYFFAWGVSFYPQVVQNFQRRSVAGLSVDFQLLNMAGFLCYFVFNASLFFSAEVKEEYRSRHGGHNSAVQLNDVFFAGHASAITLVTLLQIFAFRSSIPPMARSDRLLRRGVLVFLAGLALVAGCLALVVGFWTRSSRPPAAAAEGRTDWLAYLVLLSQVKVVISVVKYCPQVLMNYRRKSTDGWNIINVLLDFVGGLLSVAQLLLDAWSCGDWSAVTGDPAKLLLGNFSMVFDVIFMVQHYCIYPDRTRPKAEVEGNSESSASETNSEVTC